MSVLLLMLGEALVRPWMAEMTLMAGVRTPSPMIMDVASSTTASSSPRAALLPLSTAPTCATCSPHCKRLNKRMMSIKIQLAAIPSAAGLQRLAVPQYPAHLGVPLFTFNLQMTT